MHKTITIRLRKAALLALAAGLGALSGCGDAGMFSRGNTDAGSGANFGSEIDSANVTVGHHSTRCDEKPPRSQGITALEKYSA